MTVLEEKFSQHKRTKCATFRPFLRRLNSLQSQISFSQLSKFDSLNSRIIKDLRLFFFSTLNDVFWNLGSIFNLNGEFQIRIKLWKVHTFIFWQVIVKLMPNENVRKSNFCKQGTKIMTEWTGTLNKGLCSSSQTVRINLFHDWWRTFPTSNSFSRWWIQ